MCGSAALQRMLYKIKQDFLFEKNNISSTTLMHVFWFFGFFFEELNTLLTFNTYNGLSCFAEVKNKAFATIFTPSG